MSDPGRSDGLPPEEATSDQGQATPEELFARWRVDPFPVEKSGDPLGGHPIDEPMRFLWSRRRTRADPDDPFPTAPPPQYAQVSRSVLTERVSGWRQRYFPLPDEVIDTYLGSGERVLHSEHPSLRAFIVDRFLMVLVLVGLVVAAIVGFGKGWTLPSEILLIGALVVGLVLVFQRIGDRYTSYVITNVRMIRMSGIVSRSIESIPWIRVTDLGFEQSSLERLLGYATLHIESANETMGLRQMRGIADPVTFNRHLMDMVVAKQGPAAPLGRRSEYTILPEDRGIFARRRLRKARERAERAVLDDSNPRAGTMQGPDPVVDPSDPEAAMVERERPPPGTDLGDI